MNHHMLKPVVTPALLAAIALAVGGAASAALAQPAPPSKVAVVDISKAFDAYNRTKDATDEVRRAAEEEDRVIKEKQAKLQELQTQIQSLQLDRSGQRYQDLMTEARKAQVDLDVAMKLAMDRVTRKRLNQAYEIYQEVTTTSGEVAKRRGFTLVLGLDTTEPPIERMENEGQLADFLRVRKVIWHDESTDITNEVIQSLNRKYASQKPTGPAARP